MIQERDVGGIDYYVGQEKSGWISAILKVEPIEFAILL